MAVSPSTSTHNDALIRALEQEREALLAKTHAAFSIYSTRTFDEEDDEELVPMNTKTAFRDSVRERQARLEALRREDAARRRASRRASASSSASTSPQSSPIASLLSLPSSLNEERPASPAMEFLSGYLSPRSSLSVVDSDSDTDSESECDSLFSDCASSTDSFDEEDEEEWEDSESYCYSPPLKKTIALPAALVLTRTSTRVTLTPSLESIPEHPELELEV